MPENYMSLSNDQWVSLIIGSLFLLIISRRALLNTRSHGFYRFFAFEACLILVILNIPFWFQIPLSPLQIISWILLIASILMVVSGTMMLKKLGHQKDRESSPETYHFENTSVLVREGIFRFIRHPMYSSLIFLAWGAWLKQITPVTTLIALAATVAAFVTARIEEAENLKTFGPDYQSYINDTRMFIPYIF
jgi:protein-S-isoprenylcysteine O-methyltransferase Ste14